MHGGLCYSQTPNHPVQFANLAPARQGLNLLEPRVQPKPHNQPSPHRSEQMSSVSGLGSISMRRCTRYTVVALRKQCGRAGRGLESGCTAGGWMCKHALAGGRREALARCRTPRMLPATPMHDHCKSWPGCKRAYTVHAQCMHSASQRRFSGAQPPCPPYRCEASSSIAVAGCTKWVTSAMCTCRHEAASEEQPCQPGATGKGASPCPTATTSSRGPQQAKRARGWPTAHTQATRGSRPARNCRWAGATRAARFRLLLTNAAAPRWMCFKRTHPQLEVAVGQAAHVQRIINIFAAGRVHAAHRQVAQVRPAAQGRQGFEQSRLMEGLEGNTASHQVAHSGPEIRVSG